MMKEPFSVFITKVLFSMYAKISSNVSPLKAYSFYKLFLCVFCKITAKGKQKFSLLCKLMAFFLCCFYSLSRCQSNSSQVFLSP